MPTEDSTRKYALTFSKDDFTIIHTSLGRKLDELQRNEQTQQAAEICSLADRLYTEFSSQFGAPGYSVTVSESDLRRIHGAVQNRVGARRFQKEAVQSLLTYLEVILTGRPVFYETTLTFAPIAGQRGQKTERYIIAVATHDAHGNPFPDLLKRVREAFNSSIQGRTAADPVDVKEVSEADLPEDGLEIRAEGPGYKVWIIKDE